MHAIPIRYVWSAAPQSTMRYNTNATFNQPHTQLKKKNERNVLNMSRMYSLFLSCAHFLLIPFLLIPHTILI